MRLPAIVTASWPFWAIVTRRPTFCNSSLAISLVERVVLGQQHMAAAAVGEQPAGEGIGVGSGSWSALRAGMPVSPWASGSTTQSGCPGRGAVGADLPAHQLDQAAADGQPQPGAAVLAGGGAVGLLEGFEELGLLFGVEADPWSSTSRRSRTGVSGVSPSSMRVARRVMVPRSENFTAFDRGS